EIRLVAIHFLTTSDDKDSEEPLSAWIDLGSGGHPPLATRELGRAERWGDHEDEGPYYFRLSRDPVVNGCGDITLHLLKQPNGSATGHGWWMAMDSELIRADGI